MPFDGSGNYAPPSAPAFPAISGQPISSTYYNSVINDLTTAINNCITRDGQGRPSAAINWNGQDLTNVGAFGISSLTASGNATVGGTLGVTGAATLANNLSVSGTLGLTGAATFASSLTITGAISGGGSISTSSGGGSLASMAASGDITACRAGGATGVIFFGSGGKYLFFNGTNYEMPGANLTVNGSLVWTQGNDGSGSGLDADLLDGLDSASFLRREVSTWQTSSDGVPRYHYTTSGSTHISTPDNINFWLGTSTVLASIDASGNFNAIGNVSAYSDERLKTNWRKISDGFVNSLALVKSGVYDRVDIALTQVGVSAQDIKKILPEAVLTDNSGRMSLNYGATALVAAVELARRVVELERRLAMVGG